MRPPEGITPRLSGSRYKCVVGLVGALEGARSPRVRALCARAPFVRGGALAFLRAAYALSLFLAAHAAPREPLPNDRERQPARSNGADTN